MGASGIGLEETQPTLSSDGITSAFLNALAVRDGAEPVEKYIEESMNGNPPLVFSSLFPYGPDPDNATA